MRSLAREAVFKFIFSRLFNPDDEGLFAVLSKDLPADDKKFAKELLSCVDARYEEYISALDRLAVGYKADRVLNADKCAIILGMAELDGFPDTPRPVAIDEAVKIAARYSTESSTDFVNGILASYVKEK